MTTDLRNILVLRPDSASSDILHNVGTASSPFTGGVQQTELPGARWRLTFSYAALQAGEGRLMKAVKAICRGGAEVVHIYDLSYVPRRLIEPGLPAVGAAGQSGTVLGTTGWTPGTPVLEVGDQLSYLSTDGLYRMHTVVSPATSDAGGNANVFILPPMRNPPVAGTPISSVEPTVSAMLQDGGDVSVDGVVHATTLVFVEALYGLL